MSFLYARREEARFLEAAIIDANPFMICRTKIMLYCLKQLCVHCVDILVVQSQRTVGVGECGIIVFIEIINSIYFVIYYYTIYRLL